MAWGKTGNIRGPQGPGSSADVQTVSGSFTATANTDYLAYVTSGSTLNCTLPAATASGKGAFVTIKVSSISSADCTMVTGSNDSFDDSTTPVVPKGYARTFVSNGSGQWLVINTSSPPLAPSSPTGTVIMYASKTAPTGYLLCDGSAVSRSTYATLYGIIGTTYGSGDGSSTFNLPNLTSRMPYGAATPGSTGGSGSHSHNVYENSHSHSVTDNGHQHNFTTSGHSHSSASHYHSQAGSSHQHGFGNATFTSIKQGTSTAVSAITGGYTGNTSLGSTDSTTPNATGGSTDSGTTGNTTTGISLGSTAANGGTDGQNNLPPYLALCFMIKT